MCSHFIDQNSGHLAGDYSERIIGITPTSLKKVPVRVCVAAGLDKKYAIQAALNGG
jgi:DNA-binding transcriptional regulator LsrR (DeoR family)